MGSTWTESDRRKPNLSCFLEEKLNFFIKKVSSPCTSSKFHQWNPRLWFKANVCALISKSSKQKGLSAERVKYWKSFHPRKKKNGSIIQVYKTTISCWENLFDKHWLQREQGKGRHAGKFVSRCEMRGECEN